VVVEVIFVAGSVIVEVILGVALAHLLNLKGWVASFIRSVVLGPTMLPTIVVALVFSYMLQSGTGVISYLLRVGGFHQAWLDNGPTALAVLIGIDAWQFTPFVALLVLAGLQGIPKDTLEAGQVDGAGWYRLYRHITLPQLRPVIVASGLLRFIDAIQVFPTIYILTKGGPGTSTTALNFYGYEQYFQFDHKTAGAAIAVILTVATIAAALGLSLTARLGGSRGR
jgi:multiple sugar transport system permease protein